MSGFTEEQITSLQAMLIAAVHEAFDKQFAPLPPLQSFAPVQIQQATQATQHSIPPAPQAQKEEANVEETRPQPLYQATVEDAEDNTETTPKSTKHGSTKPDSKSTLSSMPCLCTIRSSGNSAACLSDALLAARQHTSFLASQLGYIECIEGMEASGEG